MREKARLAAMTQEERNEKNRKRREQYHKKKQRLELNQQRKTHVTMKIVTGYIETTHMNPCRLITMTDVSF